MRRKTDPLFYLLYYDHSICDHGSCMQIEIYRRAYSQLASYRMSADADHPMSRAARRAQSARS